MRFPILVELFSIVIAASLLGSKEILKKTYFSKFKFSVKRFLLQMNFITDEEDAVYNKKTGYLFSPEILT